MTKIKAEKIIFTLIAFVVCMFGIQFASNAASFTPSAKTTLTTGESTTLTVNIVDCVGKFEVVSSDSSVVSVSSSVISADDPNNVTYTRKCISYS